MLPRTSSRRILESVVSSSLFVHTRMLVSLTKFQCGRTLTNAADCRSVPRIRAYTDITILCHFGTTRPERRPLFVHTLRCSVAVFCCNDGQLAAGCGGFSEPCDLSSILSRYLKVCLPNTRSRIMHIVRTPGSVSDTCQVYLPPQASALTFIAMSSIVDPNWMDNPE